MNNSYGEIFQTGSSIAECICNVDFYHKDEKPRETEESPLLKIVISTKLTFVSFSYTYSLHVSLKLSLQSGQILILGWQDSLCLV